MYTLTVRAGALRFEAPHGSFAITIGSPALAELVASLPDGVELRCDGQGERISEFVALHGTITTDLTPYVDRLPDAVIDGDPKLVRLRLRRRLAAGDAAGAAQDCRTVLRANLAEAIDDFEALPEAERAAVLPELLRWTRTRPASFRVFRWIPLRQWTRGHLRRAFASALENLGHHGPAPGIPAADLLDALAAAGEDVGELRARLAAADLSPPTARSMFAVRVPADAVRVVGVAEHGVYVQRRIITNTPVQRGARSRIETTTRAVLCKLGFDGEAVAQWDGVNVAAVLGEVAVDLGEVEGRWSGRGRLVELATGQAHCEVTSSYAGYDARLLWQRGADRSEGWIWHVYEIASGAWLASVVLPAFDQVEGMRVEETQVLVWTRGAGRCERRFAREGGRAGSLEVSATVLDALTIVSARGEHHGADTQRPWAIGHGWKTIEGAGWRAYQQGTGLLVGESVPGDRWQAWRLCDERLEVDLAPPWLVLRRAGEAVLVRLAELATRERIDFAGVSLAERAPDELRPRPTAAVVAWWDRLVAAGLVEALAADERDRLLMRRLGPIAKPQATSLARLDPLGGIFSMDEPLAWPGSDDWARLVTIAAAEGVELGALRRVADEHGEHDLHFSATRDGRTTNYAHNDCIWQELMSDVDRAFVEHGAVIRVYRLRDMQDGDSYAVIKPAVYEALVAAGVKGMGPHREADGSLAEQPVGKQAVRAGTTAKPKKPAKRRAGSAKR